MSRTNAINGDIATFADNAPLNTFLRRRYEITNGTASGAPDAQGQPFRHTLPAWRG